MSMTSMPARSATWLELVTLPAQSPTERPAVTVHAINSERPGCVAIAVHGRLLRATNGRLSVFGSLDAVQRFLSLAGITHWSVGLPLGSVTSITREDVECLQLSGGMLRPCDRCRTRRRHKPVLMPVRQEQAHQVRHVGL